jgi:hypothetical protein
VAPELESPVHETVVVSPDRVAVRVGLRNACKTRLSSLRKLSAVSIETDRRPFPALSAFALAMSRPFGHHSANQGRSPEAAIADRFLGSPTVRVDGSDIDPAPLSKPTSA